MAANASRSLIIRGYPEFCTLGDAWDELATRTGNEAAWLTHGWLDCWWRAFGTECQMFIPTVWEDDRLVAAAPMMVKKEKVKRIGCRVLRFMENGLTPRSQLLLDPSFPEAVNGIWRLILSERKRWDLAVLANVPHQDVPMDIWRDTLAASGLRFVEMPDRQSPFIDLSQGYEAFLAGISRKQRENIKASGSRLSRRGTVNVRVYARSEELLPVLEVCAGISSRSWKAVGHFDLASRPAHRAFYRSLATEPSTEGRLLVFILRLDEQPIAFNIVVRSGSYVTGLVTDYNLDYKQASPGVYLLSRLLEELVPLGVSRCDMAGQAYEYKLSWTKDYLPHSQFRIFHGGAKSRLLYRAEILAMKLRRPEPGGAIRRLTQGRAGPA